PQDKQGTAQVSAQRLLAALDQYQASDSALQRHEALLQWRSHALELSALLPEDTNLLANRTALIDAGLLKAEWLLHETTE
ncbi:hypothetical protein, partial [Enterococcus faecalis]|uniref:hypothetical protein n=1 Tax=Enterococcus faecalis TaxID=1351 RepID=UPI00403F66B4